MVSKSITVERLGKMTVWATGSVVLFSVVCSLFWRMYLDTPVLLYLAKQVLHGALPYRDFVDMNLPLTYGLLGGVAALGGSDFSVAVAQTMVVAIISGLMFAVLAGAGRWAAALGICMGLLRVYSATWGFVLQRELFALIPIAGMLWMGFRPVVLRTGHMVLAGTCLACLALIKPQLTVYALPALVLMGDRLPTWRARGRAVAWISSVFLAWVGCCAAWLVVHAAWDGFCDVVRYWFLYGQMSFSYVFLPQPERFYSLVHGMTKMVFSPYLGLAIVSLGVGRWSGALTRREWMGWCALIALSIVVPALSGQFWGYHRLPFFYFCMVSSAYLLTGPRWSVISAAGIAILWMAFTLPRVVQEMQRPATERLNHGVADYFAAYLKQHASAGVRVQPMDWADGALHGMLLADAQLATRFPYTFYFYHHVSHPLIQRFRASFMEELRKNPPAYMLEVMTAPKTTGMDTESCFVAFDCWRMQHYRVASQTAYARIWALNTRLPHTLERGTP